MEATRSLTSSRRRGKPPPAFYEPASSTTSSARVMAEARQSLRVLSSERPRTPAEHNRMLFGKNRTSSRPPSVYSIDSRHFTDSRPSTAQRLEPLELPAAQLTECLKPIPPTPVQSTCDLIPPRPHSSSTHSISHATATSEEDEDGVSSGGGHQVTRRSSLPPGVTPHPPPVPPGEGARGRRTRRNKSDPPPQFWDTEIAPLLSRLTQPHPASEVREAVGELHHRLKERQCYGHTGGVAGVKQRSSVLRVVFSLLDSSDASLLVKLASIIIAMEVTGKNLLNVCKLLFSLARTESNDQYFREETIAGPLLRLLNGCDAVSDSDTLVYGVGTVKLLASDGDLCRQLCEGQALSFLHSLLNSYSQQERSGGTGNNTTSTQNVLVQVTAVLRNLLEHGPLLSSLLSSGLLPQLAQTLSSHLHHPDITFNITRLLSKLSLDRGCCEAIADCPSFLPLLLQSLTVHHSHPDILVRVCFILGNLTADDDRVRHELCSTHHALSSLTSLTTSCLETELAKVRDEASEHERSGSEELLIKLVRLLANVSVSGAVGCQVASDKATVDTLMTILSSLPLASYHELIVNTLATLNNLSYHAPQASYLLHNQQHLSQLLVRILLEDDGGPLLECVRCYGNLSRHSTVRETISKSKVDELLITLLDSSRHELVYASCGVLVNLMTDPLHRPTLLSSGGVGKLLDVLRDFGSSDWQLASLVCQILWNFSDGITSSVACFGEAETEQLLHILHSYTEEPETLEEEWRQHFVPVGTGLLNRVSSHYTLLVPLDHPQ